MARPTHQTALAASLAVGSELSRRGYDVAFTMGNCPRIDLICAVPDGQPFKVQVNGISNENAFYVQKKFFDAPPQSDLFLVIVVVPPVVTNKSMRFFVLSHAEARAEAQKMPTHKRDGRPYENGAGLNWGSIKGYENHWEKLPASVHDVLSGTRR